VLSETFKKSRASLGVYILSGFISSTMIVLY
jgi:hypothetical protein